MRLLPNIRFGTEGYPEKVARRLRALNIATWLASATHLFYAVVLLVDAAQFWWLSLANLAAALLYAAVPLIHPLSRVAGPIVVEALLYADMFGYIYLLGSGIGIQFYYLVGAALAALYLGPDSKVLAVVLATIAAALIAVSQMIAPYNTGLLPDWLIVASLVTNAVVSCGVLLLIVSYALREAARAEETADREYRRSERLLTNILPAPIAARLKGESGTVIADRYDEASILFADMAGFTAQASDTAPDDLVRFLNRVFSDFDRLVEQHGLEKIKTTGDAYMVASGVPIERADHAQALAQLALEMRDAALEWRDPKGRNVPIRIGIGSGPVVAGVVGTRKFFYDVWGDAVNVASRMETTGEAGKIQVSGETYERLKNQFAMEARGEIEVKGKGRIPTWFLMSQKPPAIVQASSENSIAAIS